MEYEPSHEASEQDERDKLQFLAAVFRIAHFGEDESPGSGDMLPYGQQGYAVGPAGDVVAAIRQGMQFDPDGLYRESDRAHVASLQLGHDMYQIYAVCDQLSNYDAYPLHRAIVDLNYVDYDRFPGSQPPFEEMVDALWRVSFDNQRLEIYKNLPTKYDLDRGVSHQELGGILGAWAVGDFEKAARLSQEPEVDTDELYDLEISHAREVDIAEIRTLTNLLSEEYFVAGKPPPVA